MKTLFGETEKHSVDKTKITDFKDFFEAIGYDLIVNPVLPFESKADIVQIKSLSKLTSIYAMQWLRPTSRSKHKMTQALSNYPRLNIPSAAMKVADSRKVAASMFVMERLNMYFLVILPNTQETMFWLGKYSDIPQECWKLNWWKDSNVATRLLLHNFDGYNLVNLEGLKNQLDKLFDL